MSRYPDRDLFLFPLKGEKKGKAHFTPFPGKREKQGKAGKAQKFPREVLFQGREKHVPKIAFSYPQKQSCFSRGWEKLKSGSKPPRQTPGRSGHGTTEFGLKLPREILEIEEENVF
jgi:hypothetical protein